MQNMKIAIFTVPELDLCFKQKPISCNFSRESWNNYDYAWTEPFNSTVGQGIAPNVRQIGGGASLGWEEILRLD